MRYDNMTQRTNDARMRLHVLASGSKGNAAIVENMATGDGLLIDCGICKRDFLSRCDEAGFDPHQLRGVLITHEHTDHIAGLATYIKKYPTPILCSSATGWRLVYRLAGVEPLLRPLAFGEALSLIHI